MGIQQQVDGILKRVRKDNTTNPRLGKEVSRRATDIASELQRNSNPAKEAQFVQILKDIQQPFESAAGNSVDRLAPFSFMQRQKALIEADARLDELEGGPSEGREKVLANNADKDYKNIRAEIQRLCSGASGSLEQMLQAMPNRTSSQNPGVREKWEKVMKESNKEFAELMQTWARFEDKVDHLVDTGIMTSPTTVHLINMDKPDDEPIIYALESNTTFGSLAEQMMASNIDEDDSDEGYLPDFYLRKQDPKHNCVTTSGQWWEVQDGETLVNSRKSTGKGETQKVELVVRNKDYVIALLNDEGNERGIPVEFPKKKLSLLSDHLETVWPDRQIVKVCKLLDGSDVSDAKFHRVTFAPRSNPLYVELGEKKKVARHAETV